MMTSPILKPEYSGDSAICPGFKRAVPIFLNDNYKIAYIHVGNHTLGFNRYYGRPRPADQEESQGNSPDNGNDPEYIACKGHRPVITFPELRNQCSDIFFIGFICHFLTLLSDFTVLTLHNL
jgi:hypothetical protein